MVETMRQVTFNLIVILHLRHDVTDRSTWPAPQRLKALIEPYGLASPRRIGALVARLVHGRRRGRLSCGWKAAEMVRTDSRPHPSTPLQRGA
jgi:hypothetical protein